MKEATITPRRSSPLRAIICKIFGHKYRVTRRCRSKIKEFECAKCEKQFTFRWVW